MGRKSPSEKEQMGLTMRSHESQLLHVVIA